MNEYECLVKINKRIQKIRRFFTNEDYAFAWLEAEGYKVICVTCISERITNLEYIKSFSAEAMAKMIIKLGSFVDGDEEWLRSFLKYPYNKDKFSFLYESVIQEGERQEC